MRAIYYILPILLILNIAPRLTFGSEIIVGSRSDNEVRDNSQVSWSGGSTYRAGGVSSGRDGAIVIGFKLPALSSGESVTG
ncbi:hypothetical protein MLD52_13580, partial [Puniceicoccaceae bacterium K14]|nr:hypothetical protein [Puniceicoccaceae bacterium K14]